MDRLFGKGKPKEPAPNLNDCIAGLDTRASKIEEKITQMENELRKYHEQVVKKRERPAKNSVKQKALRVLKEKKAYEQQAESLRNQSFNMAQANNAAQALKDTQRIVKAMKDGVKQMQKEFKKVDIDQIENIQDEMADMLEQADEVQEALGRTYRMPEVDIDELEAEFNALGEEIVLDDDTTYLDDVGKAPSAPDKEPEADSVVAGENVIETDEFDWPRVPTPSKTSVGY